MTKTGKIHRQDNLECQDQVCHREEGQSQVIVLADGTGFSNQNVCCVRDVVQHTADTMLRFSNTKTENLNKETIIKELMEGIVRIISGYMDQWNLPAEELASTLLAFAINHETGKYLFIHLGDGMIIGKSEKRERIFSYPTNRNANETFLTTSENLLERMKVRQGDLGDINQVLLCSDGCYECPVETGITDHQLWELITQMKDFPEKADDQSFIQLKREDTMEEKFRIHDGRTRGMRDVQLEGFDMEILNIDDFIYDGREINDRFNEYLREWKHFSTHRYVINLLSALAYEATGKEELEHLYREMENEIPLSEDSEKILNSLIEYLFQRVNEIANDSLREELLEKYPKDVLRQNLFQLEEDFFLEFLAPLLDMNINQITAFLVRVLKGDQLCSYIPKEYLLELAVGIYEKLKSGSTIEILYELNKGYERAEGNAGNLFEESEAAEPLNGTIVLTNKKENVLEMLENRGLEFCLEDYPEIEQLLSWHKKVEKPTGRDRKKYMRDLFLSVYDLYADELSNFVSILKDQEIKRAERWNYIPLTVRYKNTGNPVTIQKGVEFSGKRTFCVVEKDVVLEPGEYVEILVHVQPHEDNVTEGKPDFEGQKWLKEGTKLRVLNNQKVVAQDGNEKELVKNVRVDVMSHHEDKFAFGKNSDLWTKPKLYADPKGSSFVILEILEGAQLPEDVIFEYNGYQFLPTKESLGKTYYHEKIIWGQLFLNQEINRQKDGAKVPIEKENKKNKKKNKKKNEEKDREKDKYILEEKEETWKMCFCSQEARQAVISCRNISARVTLPVECVDERGRIKDAEIDEHILENTNLTEWEQFAKYMYGEEDYWEATGLDMELHEKIGLDLKEISLEWLKDSMLEGDESWFENLSEYRKRNILLVLFFLKYLKEVEWELVGEQARTNFEIAVDAMMLSQRLDGFYLGYPLDCLLMFLLSSSEGFVEGADTLRVLYKEAHRQDAF